MQKTLQSLNMQRGKMNEDVKEEYKSDEFSTVNQPAGTSGESRQVGWG